MPTLYQAVLGPEFARLAPVLRGFHGEPEGGRAHGRLRVVRGAGLLARFAGWCIGAPAAGEGVSVDMHVEVRGERERWTQSFAGAPMITRQWREGDRLIEALGPSALVFALERDGEAMLFRQRGCRVLGIPLPRWLSPAIEARASASERGRDSWAIAVEIRLPAIGLVVGYSGTMQVESP